MELDAAATSTSSSSASGDDASCTNDAVGSITSTVSSSQQQIEYQNYDDYKDCDDSPQELPLRPELPLTALDTDEAPKQQVGQMTALRSPPLPSPLLGINTETSLKPRRCFARKASLVAGTRESGSSSLLLSPFIPNSRVTTKQPTKSILKSPPQSSSSNSKNATESYQHPRDVKNNASPPSATMKQPMVVFQNNGEVHEAIFWKDTSSSLNGGDDESVGVVNPSRPSSHHEEAAAVNDKDDDDHYDIQRQKQSSVSNGSVMMHNTNPHSNKRIRHDDNDDKNDEDIDKDQQQQKSPKKKRKNRCGRCIGCSRPKCGLCGSCLIRQQKIPHQASIKYQHFAIPCCFRPCTTYSTTNYNKYAFVARASLKDTRDPITNCSPLDDLFQEVYGSTADNYKCIPRVRSTLDHTGHQTALPIQPSTTTTATTTSSKPSRHNKRCGTCKGCMDIPCNQCLVCTVKQSAAKPPLKVEGISKCCFLPCGETSSTTQHIYRSVAIASLNATRDDVTGRSPLDDKFIKVFGYLPTRPKDATTRDDQRNDHCQVVPTVAGNASPGVQQGKLKNGRCGLCSGCLRRSCGHCVLCQAKLNGNNGPVHGVYVCCFRPCRRCKPSTLKIFKMAAAASIKKLTNQCNDSNNDNNTVILMKALFDEVFDPNPALPTTTATSTGPRKDRNRADIELGIRVYARWPDNDNWYWGTVVNKYKRSNSNCFNFTIKFDDGDIRKFVPYADFVTEEEYESDSSAPKHVGAQPCSDDKPQTEMDNPEESSVLDRSAESAAGPSHEPLNESSWWSLRCRACTNCLKPRCMRCVLCRDPKDVRCYQKMCMKLKREIVSQPAPGFPTGWKFFFQSPGPSGLRLMDPSERLVLKSVKNAIARFSKQLDNVDEAVFCEFVGLDHDSSNEISPAALFDDSTQDHPDELAPMPISSHITQNPLVAWDKTRRALSWQELRSQACGRCDLCVKRDCLVCASCVNNRNTSCVRKGVCLRKTCLQVHEWDKAQCIPGIISRGLRFYWSTQHQAETTIVPGETSVHEQLNGLIIVSTTTQERYRSLELAIRNHYPRMLNQGRIIQEFYEEHLGTSLLVPTGHSLVGKTYHQIYLGADCHSIEVFGCFKKCKKDILTGSLQFTVEYVNHSWVTLHRLSGLSKTGTISKKFDISEEYAWEGYVSYLTKIQLPIPSDLPFHRTLVVPSFCHEDPAGTDTNGGSLPRRILIVDDVQLVLHAKDSSIPGAGLGLWLECTPLGRTFVPNREFFQLPAGCLVDLGIYAPLVESDIKTSNICWLKNFLFDFKCEIWSFEMGPQSSNGSNHDQPRLLDITDDYTGELHAKARNNILVYTNETNGRTEIPTVHPWHDPQGRVHYLLGHSKQSHGPMQILYGRSMEIKVDYGIKYERARVRKQYPRVNGAKLKAIQREIEHDDQDLLLQWSTVASGELIMELTEFMERFLQTTSFCAMELDSSSAVQLERVLLVLLVLYDRTKQMIISHEKISISDSSGYADDDISWCDNGLSDITSNGTIQRLRKLLASFCTKLDERIFTNLLANNIYMDALAPILGLDVDSGMSEIHTDMIRNKIQSLINDDIN